MNVLEIDINIDPHGKIHLPAELRDLYGQNARITVRVSENPAERQFDPMTFSGTVQWPVDGIAWQREIREEWD